jgi:hypothetical protein
VPSFPIARAEALGRLGRFSTIVDARSKASSRSTVSRRGQLADR